MKNTLQILRPLLFIIPGFLLLVVGILWLRNYTGSHTVSSQPQYSIQTSSGAKYTISGEVTLTPIGGAPTDTVTIPPVIVDPGQPIPTSGLAEKIGLDVFPWTGLQRVKDMGITRVRPYVPLHWIFTAKGFYGEPFYQAYTNEAPGLDTYLAQAKSLGIDVLLCANQTPEWMRPTGNGNGGNDYPPIKAGANRLDPKSYEASGVADCFFQLAARYGRVKHSDGELRVDQTPQYPNQPLNQKKSGLDLLKRIEIQNELDHWFEGFQSEKYLKPQEHAALLVAVVKAIRRGDPSFEIYMGGITDFQLDYLKTTYATFVALWPEGKDYFPHINVHHYSNILNKPGSDKPTWAWDGGCYPEDDPAFSQIYQIVAWAKSIGKKCIVTEFGYDKKAPSMMHIVGKGISDAQAQAQGIVKTYRAYLTAGVDAAYCFEAADEPHGLNGGQFATCGILGRQLDGFPPHPAYAAVKAMMQQLSAPGMLQAMQEPSNETAHPGAMAYGQTIVVGDMRQAAKKFPLPNAK